MAHLNKIIPITHAKRPARKVKKFLAKFKLHQSTKPYIKRSIFLLPILAGTLFGISEQYRGPVTPTEINNCFKQSPKECLSELKKAAKTSHDLEQYYLSMLENTNRSSVQKFFLEGNFLKVQARATILDDISIMVENKILAGSIYTPEDIKKNAQVILAEYYQAKKFIGILAGGAASLMLWFGLNFFERIKEINPEPDEAA